MIRQAIPVAGTWVHGRVGAKLRDFRRESLPFASVPVMRQARDAIADLVTV